MLSFAEFVVLLGVEVNSIDRINDAEEQYEQFVNDTKEQYEQREFLAWCVEKAMKYNDLVNNREQICENNDEKDGIATGGNFRVIVGLNKGFNDLNTIVGCEPCVNFEDGTCEDYYWFYHDGWDWDKIRDSKYKVTYKFNDCPISVKLYDGSTYFVNETTGENNMPGTCHGWDEEELEKEERIKELIEWGNRAYAEEFYNEINWVNKTLERYDRIEGLKQWSKYIDKEYFDYENKLNDCHATELLKAYDIIHDSIENGSVYNIEKAGIILRALREFGDMHQEYGKYDIKLDCISLSVSYTTTSLWDSVVYSYDFWDDKWEVKHTKLIFMTYDYQIPTDEAYKYIINILIKRIKAFN